MIQAVLFDMDGTLIDTEKYYRIFWPKALAACGYTMTDEQALTMRSLGRPFAPRQLKDWYGEDFDYYVVRDKRKEMMEETLDREGIKCKPGAVELLEDLYACKQLGLAPEECMAVEDSPNGVMSAYRAGCKVVMVPDQTQPDEKLKKCLYACVPTLADISHLI